MINRLLDLAIQIQQIPAPTFDEKQRAEFVRGLFVKEKLSDVSMDSTGNVYGRWTVDRGRQKPPLIVSAHLDTVFSRNTSLHCTREEDRVYAPGIGDNSLGVAALFGLLWMLRERKVKLAGDVWLVANVCEEGLGDLRGMKAVTDRFGGDPSTPFVPRARRCETAGSGQGVQAYLVLEGTALGHLYHRAVGVRRYRVTARTAGGHSWSDYGRPSAVHELARLVTQITALHVPTQPRTTLNVGLISGGTGVNVLASEATLELDLRSESMDALNSLIAQVEEKINTANQNGVNVQMEVIGQRPAGEIFVDHPLVKLAEQCLTAQGIKAVLTSGSTDANIPLSRGFPAIVLGITTGGGAHTVHEYINVEPISLGMEQLVEFVSRVWV